MPVIRLPVSPPFLLELRVLHVPSAKVGHPLSFAWAPINPCMRDVSSLFALPILGLGASSGGGQRVVAGMLSGGDADAAGWLPGAHSAYRFPSAGLVGGGRAALVRLLTSDMSKAAPNRLRDAFIVSLLDLMTSPVSLASLLASVARLAD
jgi:hypothetical protein